MKKVTCSPNAEQKPIEIDEAASAMAEPYCSAGLGPAPAVGVAHFQEEMAFAVVFHQVKLIKIFFKRKY